MKFRTVNILQKKLI